jgi:mevalonate kinase
MNTGSSWGKVILLGEHAVVYGYPSLAVGIARGTRAVVRPMPLGPSVLAIPRWSVHVSAAEPTDLSAAFAALLRCLSADERPPGPVLAELESDLPPGVGLGCSASLGVAVARALVPDAAPERVMTLAAAWERIFHGNPSGVDFACSANGGCLRFRRGVSETISIGRPLTFASRTAALSRQRRKWSNKSRAFAPVASNPATSGPRLRRGLRSRRGAERATLEAPGAVHAKPSSSRSSR